MSPAKTAAQRQAERKARLEASGMVRWARWVHPDVIPYLDAVAKVRDKQPQEHKKACVSAHDGL